MGKYNPPLCSNEPNATQHFQKHQLHAFHSSCILSRKAKFRYWINYCPQGVYRSQRETGNQDFYVLHISTQSADCMIHKVDVVNVTHFDVNTCLIF